MPTGASPPHKDRTRDLRRLLSPPEQLRTLLAERKAQGTAWEAAWQEALAEVAWPHDRESRIEWKAATQEMETIWQSCYLDIGMPVDFDLFLDALVYELDYEEVGVAA